MDDRKKGTAAVDSCRILVMEDDEDINRLLCTILRKKGYSADGAFSGSEGRLCLSAQLYDLILLDLMLPGLTGERFLEEIRPQCTIPVIVLSAKTSLEDKVNAFALGADDYVTKPFETAEILARVEAQLRRCREFSRVPASSAKNDPGHALFFRGLTLDLPGRSASVNGAPLSLTAREFDLLSLLLSAPDRVFTREILYSKIWGDRYYGEDNTVNVHISNIRGKLAQLVPDTEYIKTVWGIGFKMAD